VIRSAMVFLAALLLGALTVSGQEQEADTLRKQIRELSDRLKQRADLKAPQDVEQRAVQRFYDVGGLVQRIRDAAPYPVCVLRPSKYSEPEGFEEPEACAPFEIDMLIDLARQLVEPESWDTVENADIQVKQSLLVVTQIPRVHRKLEALLASLRAGIDRQLRLQFVAVPVGPEDAALLDNRPRELTDDEAERLLANEPLGTATLHARSAQMVRQRVGGEVPYLQDYEVEIAQEANIGDPITVSAFEGMTVWALPTLDDSGKGVRVDLRIDRRKIARPIRRVDTTHGPLELPRAELTRLCSSMWLPLGRTVVLGGATAGDRPCVFLLRVERIAR